MSYTSACIVLAAALSSGLCAQEQQEKGEPSRQTRTMQFSAESAVFVRELGALVVEENKKIVVKFIPPKEGRPKEVALEDIEAGDEVGMANGKRIVDIMQLRKLYDEAAAGSEFKMGLRRDSQPHIVVFTKRDPKDYQGGMTIIRGEEEGKRLFPALGIGLEQGKKKVFIGRTLPHVAGGLKEGDEIRSLNGKNVATLEDFEQEFEATKIGDPLAIVLLRDGKEVSVSIPRPKPQSQMILRTN